MTGKQRWASLKTNAKSDIDENNSTIKLKPCCHFNFSLLRKSSVDVTGHFFVKKL